MPSLFANPNSQPMLAVITAQATFAQPPAWTVAKGGDAQVKVDPSGLFATITPGQNPSTRITISATADFGDGNGPVQVNDLIVVTVTPAPPINLGIVFGPVPASAVAQQPQPNQ